MLKNFPGGIGILDDGPVGIVISRMSDGLVLVANMAFLRLVGYASHELLGATTSALGLWVRTTARKDMVNAMRKTGHVFNLPVDVRCKSGTIVRVNCSALSLEWLGETHIMTTLHGFGTGADAQVAHKDEIAHLDFVEASGSIGFWDFDSRSEQVRWSYGMEAIYGLPKGGFKGTAEDFFSRIHPDDVAANLAQSQAALDDRRPFEIRFRIVRPDARIRWVVSRGAARFDADGAYLGASGLQMDVTDQVAREEETRMHALVMDNMAEGVVMVHADTAQILFANPRFEQMLGYAPGAMVGLPVQSINANSDRDPAEVASSIIAELRSHGHSRGEVKNLCADGTEIWTSYSVSAFTHGAAGKIWVSVHADITGRRLAQESLNKTIDKLQRLSLNYQDSLEAERFALARDVHDQLGASLIGMRMKLEVLAGKLRTCAPELAQDVEALLAESQNTQCAAREICTRLRPALLDDMGLAEACRWYVKDWSAQTGVSSARRIGTLKENPDLTLATNMFRVLQEFLTNVARHSGATRVHVALTSGPSGLKLRVKDNGRGFDADQETGGYGLLGVRERLRHHHGTLTIDTSALGTQMTATMRLVAIA